MQMMYEIASQLSQAAKFFSRSSFQSVNELLHLKGNQEKITEKEVGKMRLQGAMVLAFAITSGMLSMAAGGLSGVSAPAPLPQLPNGNFVSQMLLATASKLRDPKFMQGMCKAGSKGLSNGSRGAESLVQSDITKISSRRNEGERIDMPRAQEMIQRTQEGAQKVEDSFNRLSEKVRQAASTT